MAAVTICSDFGAQHSLELDSKTKWSQAAYLLRASSLPYKPEAKTLISRNTAEGLRGEHSTNYLNM